MCVENHEQGFGETSRLPKISDRREDQRSTSTQFSSRAASLEIAMKESLALEQHLASTAADDPLKQSLQRLLSVKSVISTSSSFAERQQAAVGTDTAFREIGTGSIGKVFEHPGTVWAYKLPLTDNTTKLWNNYKMNRRIENSFEQLGPLAGQVEVPHAAWYARDSTSAFWDPNIDRFEYDNQFVRKCRDILCVERIFPLPKPTRDSLIDMYCPPNGRQSARIHPANKDCLVRPLLGRKRQSTTSRLNSFSLRNFRLHIDQVQEIGLDGMELAIAMADALAVLHWHTKIDAMDIEFVLGSSPQEDQKVRRSVPLEMIVASNVPTSTFEYVTNSITDFKKRTTTLWLLDFDACSDLTMDHVGVEMACKAFIETEPYYPRPHSSNPLVQHLWNGFSNRYVATASQIVNQGYEDLPLQFLHAVSRALGPQSIPRPLSATIAYRPGTTLGGYPHRGDENRGRPSSASHPRSSVPPRSHGGSGGNWGTGGPDNLGHGSTGQSRVADSDTVSWRGDQGRFHGGDNIRREEAQRSRHFYASEGGGRRLDGPWRR